MPQDSPERDIWVTETALTTALYTSYFAENVALFAIIVGIVMLLVGIGFVVLTASSRKQRPPRPGPAPHRALQRPDNDCTAPGRSPRYRSEAIGAAHERRR